MATLFKRRLRNGELSTSWWASWKDHRGKFKSRSTGLSDENAARIKANAWERDDFLCRDGHREYVDRVPMPTLIHQYKLKLSAPNNTTDYVDETVRMIGVFAKEGSWKIAGDINAD